MSDRHYKVRCIGTEDPWKPYELSYGKGSKKIVATLERAGSIFKCVINGVSRGGMIRELKDQFETWAASIYGGEQETHAPENVPVANELPPPVTQRGPVVEARSVTSLAEKKPRVRRYDSNGSLTEQDDQPLPIVGTDGKLIETAMNYELREHKPNTRFAYDDGFALIELGTRLQHGWFKDRSRALEALSESNTRETPCSLTRSTALPASLKTSTTSTSEKSNVETTSSPTDPLPST